MARMGVAFVRGLQGSDPKYLKAVSTPKHYAGNNSEYNRHSGSSDIDEQLLHEYYLPAFAATVVEAGAFSVMSAYNRVNGVPASANPLLLRDILRDTWGFAGYVVSDCDAVSDIASGHHWTSTLAEAAAKALLAGTDLNCGRTYPDHLQEALDQGLIAESDVDRALTRVLRARFLLGEFDTDQEVTYRTIGADVIESPAHRELALEAARASLVLLKNDGLLPLDRQATRSIAVIGPHGNDVTLGGYSGWPSHRVSALDGIRAKLAGEGDVTVAYEAGASITGGKDQNAIDRAAALARTSDVAIVLVGTNTDVLREEMDRPDWNLPGAQGDLIQAVFAANSKTVVVLVTAGPVAVDWAQAHVPAILCALYGGQEQGAAIADALFGDTNPGGKLTTTWYAGSATLPPMGDYDLRKGRTYLYYQDVPLYPFGHGLSYTSFVYSGLRIEPGTLAPGQTATVSVQVKNTGSRAGDEVVQLYVHDAFASVPRPRKELRGFARVHLEPGQSQLVSFPLAAKDLAFWDVKTHGWRVEEGLFDVAVASSSADFRLQGSLTVSASGATATGGD
jgi:beta-glucosidase